MKHPWFAYIGLVIIGLMAMLAMVIAFNIEPTTAACR